MKVFLVFHGSYSDRKVVGVFDDRALAERLRDLIHADEEVDERDLNPFLPQIQEGLRRYSVEMDRDGSSDVEPVTSSSFCSDDFLEWWEPDDPQETIVAGRLLTMEVLARDEEHAVKIVNDHRRQLIAEGKWDQPTPEKLFEEKMAIARRLAAEENARRKEMFPDA